MRIRWIAVAALAAFTATADLPKLDNPMSEVWLRAHLLSGHPRLVYTPERVEQLKKKAASDPVVKNLYAAVKLNAEKIYKKPLLERRLVGKRLLSTSREMLYRMNMLGVVWLVEGDPKALDRINEELLAVCAFKDWNPKHYLDVAEMSMAFSLALDWTHGALPESTVKAAEKALLEKGLLADGKARTRIVAGENNWNQVCNGGMIAAALALADDQPELAAETIRRALDALPNALKAYMPDGVYPEGSTYWGYATSFSVTTIAMLESALGDDFGYAAFPGFKKSAFFRALCNAPSGRYFNYADCGDRRSPNGDVTLAWFAAETGNKTFFERERFLRPAKEMSTLSRLDGAGLAWICRYREKSEVKISNAWKGDGANPIVIFRGGENDPHGFYFGGKGGRATTSHGNMDAGSFVFELNGVRWVVDPGNQSYHDLEKTGFDLWNRKQNSDRWTLLTKNNFGHSTITVNGRPFVVDGFAPLADFKDGARPEATFDLTAVYGGNLKKATRRFVKESNTALLIEDRFQPLEKTKTICWQLMTVADVQISGDAVILSQDGKQLRVEKVSHPGAAVKVVPLDPPPLKLDRRIEGLKRIEIGVPPDARLFRVRLSDL